jgi:hypothetical protein
VVVIIVRSRVHVQYKWIHCQGNVGAVVHYMMLVILKNKPLSILAQHYFV